MKWFFWVFLFVFLSLYGLMNYYIGVRGWQYLFRSIPGLSWGLYWFFYWLVVWSYLVVQLGKRFLPYKINVMLIWVGSYWLGIMFYSFLIIAAIDLVRLLGGWAGLFSGGHVLSPGNTRLLALAVMVTIIIIQVVGSWNARNPQMRRYEITIPKSAGHLKDLHIVMVSDIHLGKIVGENRLTHLVNLINNADPDLVLLAGDTVDGSVDVFSEQKIDDCFRRLHPKYGAYAVLGNHEYISREVEQTIDHLKNGGVHVLRDEAVKVADSFYLVGRDDAGRRSFSGSKRLELPALLDDIDRSFPVILLDHQPQNLGEAEKLGVDLQFSGHTHKGQLFPNNFITGRVFEIDWGYLRKGDLQVIVSSGYGTWGPPIRIGSRSELVEVFVHFQPQW